MSFFVRTEGFPAAYGEMDRLTNAVTAENTLILGLGLLHRFLMGIGQSYPAPGLVGVLPVRTGRLKNSFFQTPVQRRGDSFAGYVATNVVYAPPVERSRQFLARTTREGGEQVRSLFLRSVRGQV